MEGNSMRPLLIAAALALAAAAPALAQTAEDHKPAPAKAACRAADGKAAPCASKALQGSGKAPSRAKVATPMITRCRDVISHQAAKCGGPNAEPIPAN
jgi:hypothetical protein